MKGNIFKQINKSLGKKSIIIVTIFIFLGLFIAAPTSASWAINVVGGILGAIISGLGLILFIIIKALIFIASYSTFIDSGAVTFGWVIVRDLCNMFFVVVLLIIAFGTILNIEKYNYKKWLPKLILMAILINFSKTICGILIDIAQVVMLTFVNSFASIGSGTMVDILGISDILTMSKEGKDVGFWTVIGAYILGLIYIVISLVVIVTMMAMLAMRIVMIWIYIVLSPLAYLMSAFPGGQQYASQWWSEFVKNLIVGPVIAFFLWLSFAALTSDQITASQQEKMLVETQKEQGQVAGDPSQMQGLNNSGSIGTKASSPGALIKFVIAIGMLIGGLKISQQIGGAAGTIAGKGMAAVNKAGKIGLAGAAAITGVRAAKGIYKNYSSMKKSKREDRYKNTAVNVAGKIGQAKQGVSDFVSDKAKRVTDKVTNFVPGSKKRKERIVNLDSQVAKDKEDLEVMRDNFTNKKGEVNGYKYQNSNDKTKRGWYNDLGTKVKEKEVEESVRVRENDLKKNIKDNDDEAKIEKKKQARVDKVAQTVLVGGAALATGLIPGLGPLAGLIATAPILHKNFKQSAKDDVDIGSNYRTGEIKKNEEGLKDKDDKAVLAQMDDQTVSAFARAAAGLEAMRRSLLTSEKARTLRETMKKELGGGKDDGSFKDKKLGAYFESIASKKNISVTKPFQDLKSTDPLIESQAKRDVRDNIDQGNYTLETLDTQALKDIGPEIARLMKPKDFSAQFAALKDQSKKREIVYMLKDNISDSAKQMSEVGISEEDRDNIEADMMNAIKKLASVKDINTATDHFKGTPQQQEYRKEIVADFSFTQMIDIFNGNDKDQQDAIKEIVAEAAATSGLRGDSLRDELLKIFDKSKDSLGGTSPAAKSISEIIGIPPKIGA